jgi:CheY-like chemotaxis protein
VLRILAADDEPLARRLLTEYLGRDGHSVVIAVDGREAFEDFKKGEFDLIITDRGMPEMSGDQLAAEIHRIAPDIPVIMLTGFGEMMVDTGEKPVGVDFILHKPVTLAALRQALATVLSQ